MTGEAKLEFWNEEYAIIFKGNGGGLQIDAKITDGRTPWNACLSVGVTLDQSYLPRIISELKEEFPV